MRQIERQIARLELRALKEALASREPLVRVTACRRLQDDTARALTKIADFAAREAAEHRIAELEVLLMEEKP